MLFVKAFVRKLNFLQVLDFAYAKWEYNCNLYSNLTADYKTNISSHILGTVEYL